MNIVKSTHKYEDWLRRHTPVLKAGLRLKHPTALPKSCARPLTPARLEDMKRYAELNRQTQLGV